MVSQFQPRTDLKLKFASVHLEEITSRHELGSGDAFERAHEESFLFHLIGAKDSFLQELNAAYKLGLRIKQVKETSLQKALKKKRLSCSALDTIVKLKKDKTSWLAIAIELRHQGTHRSNIPKHFYIGGEYNGKVFFTNPLTAQQMETDIPGFFRQCLNNMEELLQQLRDTLP
jgi:hypothetical protein